MVNFDVDMSNHDILSESMMIMAIKSIWYNENLRGMQTASTHCRMIEVYAPYNSALSV